MFLTTDLYRIFNEWMKKIGKKMSDLTPIDQLAYLSNRGMGALEYFPGKELPTTKSISLSDITTILSEILTIKKSKKEPKFNDLALLNIFKLGTSAGGARPKVIVSENKITKNLIPGDINFSNDYNHYLVKLGIEENTEYSSIIIEYAYYLLAQKAGIKMMESKLIDNKHFATKRYDRIAGKKKHILTATGISGLDFRNKKHSRYENLFEIGNYINIPPLDMDKLFRRMVFNYTFHNTDDHLKNHSFVYDDKNDRWNVSPAYDITYPLDPLNKWIGIGNALSVNGKNKEVKREDFLTLARKYTIARPNRIINQVLNAKTYWKKITNDLAIPNKIAVAIAKDFLNLERKTINSMKIKTKRKDYNEEYQEEKIQEKENKISPYRAYNALSKKENLDDALKEKLESIISQSARFSYRYSTQILKSEFPKGEKAILGDNFFGKKYLDFKKDLNTEQSKGKKIKI